MPDKQCDKPSNSNPDGTWEEERTIQRMGGQRALIVKLATLFLRDAPVQLEQALSGIKKQDYESSHIAMHSLKGTSSSFCTIRFENICAKLLVALAERDWGRAMEVHHNLSAEYVLLAKEFDEFTKQ